MSHFFPVHIRVYSVSIHFFPFLGSPHPDMALTPWSCAVKLVFSSFIPSCP